MSSVRHGPCAAILGSRQNVVAADGVASTVADTKNGKIYRNTIR